MIQDQQKQQIYLIGVVGIPGSGKTTLANEILGKKLLNSCALPMDGYHLYRKDLDQEGVRRRGAPFTFDKERFKKDLIQLKQTRKGNFPSFDHAIKDPKENDIQIDEKIKYVIVEGLYLFLQDWGINDLFDFKIFLQCDKDVAAQRVMKRHIAAGICNSLEEAKKRTYDNDMVNADYILSNSVIDDKVLMINSNNDYTIISLLQ